MDKKTIQKQRTDLQAIRQKIHDALIRVDSWEHDYSDVVSFLEGAEGRVDEAIERLTISLRYAI